MSDFVAKVFTVQGKILALDKALAELAELGCRRPWQAIGMALHYRFLVLEIGKDGVAYLRSVRSPVPVP